MKKYFEKIYKNSANDFYKLIRQNINDNKKMFIVTANPETLMIAEKNNNFKNLLMDKQTIIIPDGIGILKGAKKFKYNIPETIPGIEVCIKLFEYCNLYKKKIFLFGAKENILKNLIGVIKFNYPNIDICGYSNGYVENEESVFDEMSLLKPDVILVALGIPKQELLIYKNLYKFDKGIFVGVGGSFDVLSGAKKRAPKIFRKLNLEWLYRIITEPQRLKRFFSSNVKYLFKIYQKN